MIRINVVCVGKIKEKYIKEGINEFLKRLSKYIKLEIIELAEEDDNKGIQNAINSETERIINAISKKNYSYNVLLDLRGETLTSEEMAEKIEEISMISSEINFIIGGSNGVNDNLRKIVDFRLCFSPMTFPHQLMRLILTEQLYRWVSINNNIKYHK